MQLFADLAKELQLQGQEVIVITGFPNWPTGKLYPGYQLRLWQKETIDNIQVIRLFLVPDHSSSAFYRIINLASFFFTTIGVAMFLIRKPDVIHAVQPPTVGWAAWVLSCMWRVPFTYEVQDMWPESLAATGLIENERILRMIGWFSRWVYSRAAAVRVISPGFRTNLISKGVASQKIHVISNWVDTTYYRPEHWNEVIARELGFTGHFNVVYAGVIGVSQGLETVLEAAVFLHDAPKIQFIIIGEGTERKRLEESAKILGISNVRFLGQYPSEAMSGLFALADVLLVQLKNSPLFRITVPHKIFAYMASGKPILAAVEGDAAQVVREADAGLICEPGNPIALADAVRCFAAFSQREREILGENARRAACHCYNRERLVGEIGAMLEVVVSGKKW
jgi:glycosyltransferase involved in cell wall biosynthesis